MVDAANASFIVDLGLFDYREAYALQLELVEKRRGHDLVRDVFLLTEHPSTFTLGRRGGREHLMVSETFLDESNIPLVHIERGGDITFHGEGQLVMYPIISLRDNRITVVDYVNKLEDVMILLSAAFGVEAVRDERNHGVWVGGEKLGSIGIAIRHGVAYHGLALNVSVSLEPFSWVNPCGLTGVKMTSLKKITGRDVKVNEVKKEVKGILEKVFKREYSEISRDEMLTTIKVR